MRIKTVTAAVAVLALVAAGAAGAAHHAHHRAHARGTLVKLLKTKLGKVLVTGNGRALYLYEPDARNRSNCYGGCASAWPPLLTKGRPRAGAGVKRKLLHVTKRRDGKRQVTYRGHPLYRYAGDSRRGQTNGEGIGGIWYVLDSAGKKVAPAQGGGTTTGGGGGGYGGY